MRRLFGCLVMLGVLGLGVAVAGYAFVVRPMQALNLQAQRSLNAIRALPVLEQEVLRQGAWDAPAGQAPSREQVARFVRVQEQVWQTAGPTLEETRERLAMLARTRGGGSGSLMQGGAELAASFETLALSLESAKRAQVQALNQERFSLGEYRWVQQEALKGVGISFVPLDLSTLGVAGLGAGGLGGAREWIQKLMAAVQRAPAEVSEVAEKPMEIAEESGLEAYRDHFGLWAFTAALGL